MSADMNCIIILHLSVLAYHTHVNFWSVSVALFLDKRVQSKEERNSGPHGKSKAYHRNWILACVLEPVGTCWYGLAQTVGVKYHTVSKDLELEMKISQFHKSGAHCMVCSQEMTGYQQTYRWTTADLNSPWLLINLARALSLFLSSSLALCLWGIVEIDYLLRMWMWSDVLWVGLLELFPVLYRCPQETLCAWQMSETRFGDPCVSV